MNCRIRDLSRPATSQSSSGSIKRGLVASPSATKSSKSDRVERRTSHGPRRTHRRRDVGERFRSAHPVDDLYNIVEPLMQNDVILLVGNSDPVHREIHKDAAPTTRQAAALSRLATSAVAQNAPIGPTIILLNSSAQQIDVVPELAGGLTRTRDQHSAAT